LRAFLFERPDRSLSIHIGGFAIGLWPDRCQITSESPAAAREMRSCGWGHFERSIIMATQQPVHTPTEQRLPAEQHKGEIQRKPEETYPNESGKRSDPHDRVKPIRQGARHDGKDEGEAASG
jgi:hypothetical protein